MTYRFAALGAAALVLSGLSSPASGQPSWIERLDAVEPVAGPPLRDRVVAPVGPIGFNVEIPIRVVPGGSPDDTGVVFPGTQNELTGVGAPTPVTSFAGLSNLDNQLVLGTRINPPDTEGDVGPAHYVQWVNLVAQVFDKSGNSILGPFAGSSLFSGAPCATSNQGDPVVLYDQKHDRWVVSQFVPAAGIQCIAVSTDGDPTGSYLTYSFSIQGFNDYPKLGLWLNDTWDTLSATYRNFGGPGGSVSLDVQVIDYEAMLAGTLAGSLIARTGAPFLEGMLPANVLGDAFPSSDAALFGRIDSSGTAYEIYAFDGSFGGGTPTFGLLDSVPLDPIDRGVGRVPVPPPGEPLDAHPQFTMHTMTFRELASVDQILAAATADVGGDVGGAYWADIRNDSAGSGDFDLHDEGLYSPVNFGPRLERFMGSIASDANGNIAYGYSAASSVSAPSIRYTGRAPSDPPGTLRDEVVAQKGGGVQIASANRWGDYSRMSVDPVDDCTFWYTNEYYGNTGAFDFRTRVVSFRFSDCGVGGPVPTIVRVAGACGGNVTLEGSGFAANSEAAIVRSPNTNGFIKGGPLCNAAIFEVGEPIVGGPVFAFADASGSFSVPVPTQAGVCKVEAIDLGGTCLTTEVVDTSP